MCVYYLALALFWLQILIAYYRRFVGVFSGPHAHIRTHSAPSHHTRTELSCFIHMYGNDVLSLALTLHTQLSTMPIRWQFKTIEDDIRAIRIVLHIHSTEIVRAVLCVSVCQCFCSFSRQLIFCVCSIEGVLLWNLVPGVLCKKKEVNNGKAFGFSVSAAAIENASFGYNDFIESIGVITTIVG